MEEMMNKLSNYLLPGRYTLHNQSKEIWSLKNENALSFISSNSKHLLRENKDMKKN